MGPPVARSRAARQGAQHVPQGHLWGAGHPARRDHSAGTRLSQSLLPPADARAVLEQRYLCAGGGHRHRPGRRRRFLRARGQPAHALRGLLHAGEPGGDDAPLPRARGHAAHPADRELCRRIARHSQIRCAGEQPLGSDRRSAHARLPELRLLRAQLPCRPHGCGTGRRARSLRARRHGLYAHDRGAEARRRDLQPHRRRLSRSAWSSGPIPRSACRG